MKTQHQGYNTFFLKRLYLAHRVIIATIVSLES